MDASRLLVHAQHKGFAALHCPHRQLLELIQGRIANECASPQYGATGHLNPPRVLRDTGKLLCLRHTAVALHRRRMARI